MKKYYFFTGIFLLLNSFNLLKAQRYLPGQMGFQLLAGPIDDFKFFKKGTDKTKFNLFEYHVYGALSWYTPDRNRWGFGFGFMRRKLEAKNDKLTFHPVDQYIGDGFYWMPFFSNRKKNLFLSFGFGANFGYEHKNKEMLKELDSKNSTEEEKQAQTKNNSSKNNSFLYGAFLGLETEIFISNQFIFLLNAKTRYLRKSFIKDFQFNYGVGFKYILNY